METFKCPYCGSEIGESPLTFEEAVIGAIILAGTTRPLPGKEKEHEEAMAAFNLARHKMLDSIAEE